MPFKTIAAFVLAIAALGPSAGAMAQPIGTFRWQQQPYCNVITVNVVQAGAIYQLDGVDDQCGAVTAAAVAGIAFLNRRCERSGHPLAPPMRQTELTSIPSARK